MSDAAASVRQVLLVVAHGSSTDARARAVVLEQSARIATMVPHMATVTGFARGTPSVAQAVAECVNAAGRARTMVTVLPFMTSAGHYATDVLPRRLTEAVSAHGDSHVTFTTTAPLGASRRIASLLQRRALRLAARQQWSPRDVTVLLVGHGTRRHAASRDTTQSHARAMARGGWHAVRAAFIDDDPAIVDVVRSITTAHVLVLPFLIGGGAHHLMDIPQTLGFTAIEGPADAPSAPLRDAEGRTFVLDAPVGSDAALADIAATIAARAWQRNARDVRQPGRAPTRGSVHLVGAGPGAPDLISLRGQRALAHADVVLHDRLVSAEILAMARPDATLIDVGKAAHAGQHAQHAINARLIAEAQRGQRVVRLKGGDPFVFGRGSEEVDACRAAGIDVRVTPGISSALAAPAAAGIPVTARRLSRGFAVVTASTDGDDAHDLSHLAAYARADTLVVLMGRARLRDICVMLTTAGRDADTAAACVERATTPAQRVVRGTLATIADRADVLAVAAPMVLVIGATAARRTLRADVARAIGGAASA